MSRLLLRAAALVAAFLPAAGALAAPLSLEQAIDLAAQRSEMARAARAAAAGAAQRARAAAEQPDPMLGVGIDNLPVSGPDRLSTRAEDMTMKRIGIAQEWVSADKRAARAAAAGAMADREAVMARIAAAEARMQAAMAYVDAYYAAEAGALAAVAQRLAREALEAGRGRLASPAGNAADVLALTGALGAAEDEAAELRQQQAAAAATLQRWTGRGDTHLVAPRLPAVPSRDDYVDAHPQVVGRWRDIDVSRKEAALARLDRRPNWTYEVSYGQRQGRPDMVSMGISVPLPVALAARQDRETAARLAEVEKAEADLEEARRAAAGEHDVLAGDAARLQERLDRYAQGVLEPLKQRTAATLASYSANQAGLAEVFEARRTEVEAQRRHLGLRRDLARTLAQLVYKPVPNGGAQ